MMTAPRPSAQQSGCVRETTGPARFDIAFIIDRSGSVALRGQTYNIQLDGVIASLRDPSVIPRDGTVAVAVVTFAGDACIAVPLTEINSTETANSIIAQVELLKCTPNPTGNAQCPTCPAGETSYTAAIRNADNHLNQNRRQGARRVLLISSDGNPGDPDLGLRAAVEARNAATILQIPFELSAILVGLDTDSEEFQESKARVDQIVMPQPADSLPGASLAIDAGPCNAPGASGNEDDCARQAGEFAELVRNLFRSDVTPMTLIVNSEADTEPGAPVTGDSLSLRQAIELANCNNGSTTILFPDSLRGQTITLSQPLPPITAQEVIIDGCPEGDVTSLVTIDGSQIEQVADGILIQSSRSAVRCMNIVNFKRAAVAIESVGPNNPAVLNSVEQNVLENNDVAGALVLGPAAEGPAQSSVSIRNTITRNSISGSSTLIDLGGDGPTPNDDADADEGPNRLLNFPDEMLVIASDEDDTVTISGEAAPFARVEIFAATSTRIASESGSLIIEGVSFLAEAETDADGEFSLSGVSQSPTGVYTATLTDREGNTSELMFETEATAPARPVAAITSAIDFGEVNLNATSEPKQIVVANNGNAPLFVSGCSFAMCDMDDRDDTMRFSSMGCPGATTAINPGEQIMIAVTFSPAVCGPSRACFVLESNDPRNGQVLSELAGTGGGPGMVKVTLEAGASALDFGRVNARVKPIKARKRPARTFTVENTGCEQVSVSIESILRTGPDVNSGRISNADDRNFFPVVLVNTNGTESPVPASVSIDPGQSATFRVRFSPVIPAVASDTGGLSARQVLPDVVNSVLTLSQSDGASTAISLVGRVTTRLKLIHPDNPRQSPLVTLSRNGSQLSVEFSVFDSNKDVSRATYQFLDSSGRNVGQAFDIDLTQAIAQRNLARGQSFRVTQRFTQGVNSLAISSVRVTVSDGEASEAATSGPLTVTAGSSNR
jgi:hypothetical protein